MANDTLDVMMEAALKKQSQITGKFIKKQLEDAGAKVEVK
jgi:ribosomal protein L7/L12